MHNSMIEIMRTDALSDLYAGFVTPMDREILADMPLPSDMVDPFASEVADPLTTMNLTYASLSGWIAEAKKEKYYSERFVQLSKLVMKGVVTMARGLATLHKRGEDLTAAPMQVDDLISVGSYHFRKSYLGVVQFSARHPEIGERLLVNQLGWSNTLLRLYQTKEKLAKPVQNNEEVRRKNEELPNGNSKNSSFLLHNSSLDNVSALPGLDEESSSGDGAFSALDAIFAPAAYSTPRAYASFDKTGNTRSAGSKAGRRELAAKTSSETKRSENEETVLQSAEPETVPAPKEDGPLPVSEEAAPHIDPPEENRPSAVNEKTILQSNPEEDADHLPVSEETIQQNDPPEETGPSPVDRGTVFQSELPENYGTVLQAGNPERKLPWEGPSPPY